MPIDKPLPRILKFIKKCERNYRRPYFRRNREKAGEVKRRREEDASSGGYWDREEQKQD